MREGWLEEREGKRGVTFRCRYWAPGATGELELRSESFPAFRYAAEKDPKAAAQKAAKLFLAKVLVDVEGGTFSQPSNETLAVFLDRWVASKAHTVRANSMRSYESRLKHVRRELGAMPIQKVRPLHVQAMYDRLRADDIGTVNLAAIHRTLRAVFNQAMKWEVIPRNPMAAVIAPREEAPKRSYWQPGDVGVFLDSLDLRGGDGLAWALLALTGMRIGELLALEWEDVDLEKGTLRVRRSITIDRSHRRVVGSEPKSKYGRRTIPLPARCAEPLRLFKIRERERQVAARSWDKSQGDLVFANDHGLPTDYRGFVKRFRAACAAAGVPPITPHGLRHSFISALYHAGVSPLVIAALVGDSVGTILRTYAHVLDGSRETAIATMERLIASPNRGTGTTTSP